MSSRPAPDWQTGDGVFGISDPAEVDAAFARGENHLGTAVISLALTCSLEEASPRIVRAMHLPDIHQRIFAFTAAGDAARLNQGLTPELYAALRAEGIKGLAEDAIRDALTFVPHRDLPPWLKRLRVYLRVHDKLEYWWMLCTDAAEDARRVLRRRR